ncbi:chorismate mutase [Aureimonas mangrovi]|uniref:chorismate mutase n=1 Tax=Aureimonas mangrovi TaxID=2758041 RepID=UPI00163D525C|nr:chorismate mutase [Aureimonas mangrovi]
MAGNDATRLGELRAQIDAVDESVHRLLMQRASVIDELIRVKGAARGGAAFRPAREADMMRRLAARHSGPLPLTALEHLWREIISTFTALQAPFEVFVSAGPDMVAAVEAARFTVGFSVPMTVLPDAASVVARIEEGGDRLGIVLLSETGTDWWAAMDGARVVAKLPFFEAETRQAGTPALVISPALADPTPFEVECFVLTGGPDELLPGGAELLAATKTSRLIALPAGAERPAGLDMRPAGGYAAPLTAKG